MKLACTYCQQAIRFEDINIEKLVAKCRACRAVFGFSVPRQASDSAGPPNIHARPPVPMPERIKLEDEGQRLRITRRWFTPALFAALFFCIAWDAFLFFWYALALSPEGNWLAIVFPIAHVFVGVTMTYSTIAGFLNSTEIEVQSDGLSIRHGPLPWLGNHDLRRADLAQLYSEASVTTDDEGSSKTDYRLNAVLANGRRLKLLTGLADANQSLFIEHAIEQRLDIRDFPVAGEIPRR